MYFIYESLLEFLRITIGLSDGVPGVVMSIHTFGDYMEKFHPHLHALVSDSLSQKSGIFYVMPKADLGPCEEIFRAKVLKMLKGEGKIDDAFINQFNLIKICNLFSLKLYMQIRKDFLLIKVAKISPFYN